MSDIAAGEIVVARDEEWLVRSVRTTGQNETRLEVTGVSELVRDQNAAFDDTLDRIQRVDPRSADPVFDETPGGQRGSTRRETPGSRARLVRPLTREHVDVLATLSAHPVRIADVGYEWSSGWHEKGAKTNGYIEWRTEFPDKWDESIWQGPHFTVANPFSKQPNEFCRSKGDYTRWDLEDLPERVVPRTNHQRARDRCEAGLDHWNGPPFTDFWRVAWRRMTQPGLERSLHAALIPPGVAHVDTVRTCRLSSFAPPVGAGPTNIGVAQGSSRNTALVAGPWSSLPYDYLVKISGKSDVHAELIDRFPAPLDHRAAQCLLPQTLRLNCLTRDFAPLWEELHEPGLAADA